jgi:polyphosphate kinase
MTSAAAQATVSRYIDEDLSCLDVGGRLLAVAEDEASPITDRIAFLARSALALDRFFSFRGARLRQLTARAPHKGSAVRVAAEHLAERQSLVMTRLMGAASKSAPSVWDWEMLTDAERRQLSEVFAERLRPALAPLVTGREQPLPGPAALSLNVAVALLDGRGEARLGTVELPPVLERFVAVPDSSRVPPRLVPLEQIVAAHMPDLFGGFQLEGSAVYRLTRHSGVTVSRGADDLLAATELASRDVRGGQPVRLEVDVRIDADLTRRLVDQFDLAPSDVYPVRGYLELGALVKVLDEPEPRTHRRRFEAVSADDDPLLAAEGGDVVVLPDQSNPLTVEGFLAKAARDPRVLAIKQSLFRPDPGGPVVQTLIRAAERGMHVVAVVELAARGAEGKSVACARALERAGAHVVYGLEGLRTHCLASLVVAQHGETVRRYSLLSTGPHRGSTGTGSLGLVTTDPLVSADMTDLFNYLTGYSRPSGYRRMLVGPGGLRTGILNLIRREAASGPGGLIRLRVGRLVDRETIDALYAASAAGTPVEVLVGTCALRPGLRGLSDTVSVRASASEALHTSRCFGFGQGEEAIWYLASADLAPRNLDRQVAVAVPVDDPWGAKQVGEWYATAFDEADWELGADATWRRTEAAPARGGSLRGESAGPQAASFGL